MSPFKLRSSTLFFSRFSSHLSVWFSGLDDAVSISISTLDESILSDYFPLGYWLNLWSSLDFIDQPLKSCVNIIHVDIVEIWNLYDKSRVSSPQLPCYSPAQRHQYLSSNQFKINMSYVVKDLAAQVGGASPR